MAKKKAVTFVTPTGRAAFAYFHKPDTGHKYSNNKYKGDLILPQDTDLSELDQLCRDVIAEAFPQADLDDIQLPYKDGDDHKNEEFHGTIILKASSKFAPTIVDTKRNKLPRGVEARSGDEVRFIATLYPYEQTEKVREGKKTVEVTVYGVSLQLAVVQLVSKNGGSADLSLLDEIDGYDASEDDTGYSEGDDGDDTGDF